jgi:hypothetical protein
MSGENVIGLCAQCTIAVHPMNDVTSHSRAPKNFSAAQQIVVKEYNNETSDRHGHSTTNINPIDQIHT